MRKKTILFSVDVNSSSANGKPTFNPDYNIVHAAYLEVEATVLVNDYGLSHVWIFKMNS
jgi:hypothetical protein